MICTFLLVLTTVVLTVALTLLLPPGTVTLAGTEATLGALLVNATTTPPAGARRFKVTVAVELLPPFTVVGLSDKLLNDTGEGVTVSATLLLVAL